MEEAEADRKQGPGIHREIEAGNHPREHIDGQRQPWPLERSARFLIDGDQIHECVIDLNDFERPRRLVLAWRWRRRFDRRRRLVVCAPPPSFDFIDTGFDGSAIREGPALLCETQIDLPDQIGQRRALRLQINLADRLADQIVARLVENVRSLPPPSLSRLQRLDAWRTTVALTTARLTIAALASQA
jgi:hypothetical protein